jgi:hypothetical protein
VFPIDLLQDILADFVFFVAKVVQEMFLHLLGGNTDALERVEILIQPLLHHLLAA